MFSLRAARSAPGEFGGREGGEAIVKRASVSPDGLCVLTTSEDAAVRVFEVGEGELRPALRCAEGETVHDACWFPRMDSALPASCCFASTARDRPVHLWDAYSGALRASYRAFDAADEIVAAAGLAFSPDGQRLYAGFDRMLRVFDVARPGRDCDEWPTSPSRKSRAGQRGLLSSVAFAPQGGGGVLAAGSLAGTVFLYSATDGEPVGWVEAQPQGVTQVQLSADGARLYAGGRKNGELICWDLRNSGAELFRCARAVTSNQRCGFDLDPSGRFLISGSQDGRLLVFDAATGAPVDAAAAQLPAADGVADVSCHPAEPLLAVATGRRHFRLPGGGGGDDDDDDDDDDEEEEEEEEDVPEAPGLYLQRAPL